MFLSIGQLKLGLQARNNKFGPKSTNFCPVWPLSCVKFDGLYWKKNRTPLLCYFKLSASIGSHISIQTGVMVWKFPIRVKISDYSSCVTLKFHIWYWKTKGHPSYATSSFVHHFMVICEFKPELQSRNSKLCWPLTFTFDIWTWPFAWTSLLSIVINFMRHNARNIVKKVWQTDG